MCPYQYLFLTERVKKDALTLHAWVNIIGDDQTAPTTSLHYLILYDGSWSKKVWIQSFVRSPVGVMHYTFFISIKRITISLKRIAISMLRNTISLKRITISLKQIAILIK